MRIRWDKLVFELWSISFFFFFFSWLRPSFFTSNSRNQQQNSNRSAMILDELNHVQVSKNLTTIIIRVQCDVHQWPMTNDQWPMTAEIIAISSVWLYEMTFCVAVDILNSLPFHFHSFSFFLLKFSYFVFFYYKKINIRCWRSLTVTVQLGGEEK